MGITAGMELFIVICARSKENMKCIFRHANPDKDAAIFNNFNRKLI